MRERTRARQAGYSLMEMLVVFGVIAIAVAFVAVIGGTLGSGQKVQNAYSEIQLVMRAAESYRRAPSRNGLFTGLTVTALSTRGYNVEPFTSGTNENTYGLTVTAAPAAGGADATITYATGEQADCLNLVDRFDTLPGVKVTPTCTTGTLTITLE